MEGFTSILGTIGKDLGGVFKAVQPITTLFGALDQFSKSQKEKQAMDRALWYSKHPEAVSNMVTAATKPLEAGLVKGTENVVNASLAEQGLSQAPGIQSQVLAQALAPYQQNAQAMALQQVLKTIGLPVEALGAIQSTMRPDDLALMLKSILPGANDGANIGDIFRRGAISGGGPQTTPSILPDWIPSEDTGTGGFSSGTREG